MEDGVLRLTSDGESSLLPGILMVMAWVSLYPESLLSLLLHPRLLSSSIGLFSSIGLLLKNCYEHYLYASFVCLYFNLSYISLEMNDWII